MINKVLYFVCCLIAHHSFAMEISGSSIIALGSPEQRHLIARFPTTQAIGNIINQSIDQRFHHAIINGRSFTIETPDELKDKVLIALGQISSLELSSAMASYYLQEDLNEDADGLFTFTCSYRRYVPHDFKVSGLFACRFVDGSTTTAKITVSTSLEGNFYGPLVGRLLPLRENANPEDIILVSREYYPRFIDKQKVSTLIDTMSLGNRALDAHDRISFAFAGRTGFIEETSHNQLAKLHDDNRISSIEFDHEEIEWQPSGRAKVRCFYKIKFAENTAADFASFHITMFR